ncbi:MAG: DUF4836 family protein [Bacteroidota bacterium]
MPLFRTFPLFLVLAILSLTACQNNAPISDNTLHYIPADAAGIMALRSGQWMDKAGFEQLQESELYKDFLERIASQSSHLSKVLAQPEQAGIDLDRTTYIAVGELLPPQTDDAFAKGNMQLLLPLKDSETFGKLVREMNVLTIDQKETYQIAHFEGARLMWNQEVAILTPPVDATDHLLAALEGRSKVENSVASQSDLGKCLSREADFSFWTSLDYLIGNKEIENLLAMADLPPSALENNHLHHLIQFEPGEIVSETFYQINPQLKRELDLFFRDELTTDFAPYIPTEDLFGFMTVALDMRGMLQVLLERPQLSAPLNKLSGELQIAPKDLLRAFSGEMALAVYLDDNKQQPEGGLFAAQIRDQEPLNKLLDQLSKQDMIEVISEGIWKIKVPGLVQIGSPVNASKDPAPTEATYPYLLIKEDLLFITESQERLATIQAGGYPTNQHIASQQFQQLSRHIFGGQLNLSQLLPSSDDGLGNPIESIQATSDRQKTEIKIKMTDKDSNSLRQLLELLRKNVEGEQMI